MLYLGGRGVQGVPQDVARAASLFRKGCDLGNSSACHQGAEIHKRDGSLPDSTRHADLLAKGCDLGRGLACLRLGLMCDVGFGVPKDTARANALFEKGCLFDNEQACKSVRR
jgi:TPR repeat protein